MLLAVSSCGGDGPPAGPASDPAIVVAPDSASLWIGRSVRLVPRYLSLTTPVPANSLRWSSSVPSVAQVSSAGEVTGVSDGRAQITVTLGRASASAIVLVTPRPVGVVSVTFDLPRAQFEVGDAMPFAAVGRDADGAALGSLPVTWSTTNEQIATVLPDGYFTAVSPGGAAITASVGGVSATRQLNVVARTGPEAPFPQEPASSVRITEHRFNEVREDGWVLGDGASAIAIDSDASAPRSPPTIARIRFPQDLDGGASPVVLERVFDNAGARGLYLSFWTRHSDNWVGHASLVNKIHHIWIGGLNRVVIAAAGSGANALRPQIRLQQIASHGGFVNLDPNLVPSAQVRRGRWHRWEVVLRANTGGNTDGAVEWWLDGVKVGQHGGIAYVTASQGHTWDVIKLDPTWGGIGGRLPADQFLWLDHLYISGKP